MSHHIAKPENVLRKAKDLVQVNKQASALETLQKMLNSRRYRVWTATHEKIVFFFLELAVDMRRNVKDTLLQYRTICQSANASSMEKVLKEYRRLAESKAQEAEHKAAQAVAEVTGSSTDAAAAAAVQDVEDLEEESPEAIMLAAMSGEGTKERLDRQILTPWVKYLWECYRTILEVLRNNARSEQFYHATAREAFQFCFHYKRNMEFRRLCEILRSHLTAAGKHQNQNNAIDLNSQETQTLYLETRFLQLKMASEMELWQEAYRTIEDIYENMRLSRSEPKPELMKLYYEKLSAIFWASNNHLFHAYSLQRWYLLSLQDQVASGIAMKAEDRSRNASAVVLAALVILGGGVDDGADGVLGVEHEGNARLAQLLGFKKESPSRSKIIQLVSSTGILHDASDLVRQIFNLLEHNFGPLSLFTNLKPLLEQLKKDEVLARYLPALEQVIVIRVLQQLGTVFKSMKIEKFHQLIPSSLSTYQLERLIMNSVHHELLALTIDHAQKVLLFPEEDLESLRSRDQIANLSRSFNTIAQKLEVSNPAEKQQEREAVFRVIADAIQEEREAIFDRAAEIERRKQDHEKLTQERERYEQEQKAAALRARKAEEQKRLNEESARREAERAQKEKEARDLAAKQALAEEVKKKLEASAPKTYAKAEKKIQAFMEDLAAIDKIQLLRVQEEALKAQQREIERKRKEVTRRVDYTVRAARLEEKELLVQSSEKQSEEEKVQREADFQKYVEQDKKNHEKALAEKDRLARMLKERTLFQEKLLARRKEAWEVEKAKQEERMAKKREQRRILEEKKRIQREKEEEERKKREEQERIEREKQEKIAREKEEERKKKEEERAARLREANEIAERQRKREEEAEQRERERREQRTRELGGGRDEKEDRWGRGGDRERDLRRGDDRDLRRGDDRDLRRGGDERDLRRGGDRDLRRPDDRDIRRDGDRDIRRDGDRDIRRDGDRDIRRDGDRDFRRDDRDRDFRRDDRDRDFRRDDRDRDFRRDDRRDDRDSFRRPAGGERDLRRNDRPAPAGGDRDLRRNDGPAWRRNDAPAGGAGAGAGAGAGPADEEGGADDGFTTVKGRR